MENLEWLKEAACSAFSPEMFYMEPDDHAAAKAAKLICENCTVKSDCLNYAFENRINDGVFGGYTPRERRNLKNKISRERSRGSRNPQ